MVHLCRPREEKNLVPLGQKRENQPLWFASPPPSWHSSEQSLSESSSLTFFCSSLIICSTLSSVPASEISPGFLSKSPLNCFLCFLSASCLQFVTYKITSMKIYHFHYVKYLYEIWCYSTYLLFLLYFYKSSFCIRFGRLVKFNHLTTFIRIFRSGKYDSILTIIITGLEVNYHIEVILCILKISSFHIGHTTTVKSLDMSRVCLYDLYCFIKEQTWTTKIKRINLGPWEQLNWPVKHIPQNNGTTSYMNTQFFFQMGNNH